MRKKIYFRADGDVRIGLGHVIRSCALADMLEGEYERHFVIRAPLPALEKEILLSCEALHTLPAGEDTIVEATGWIQALQGNEIVVLDGYHFNTAYQQQIKDKGCLLVCIDDLQASNFVADVVINHAPGVNNPDYQQTCYTSIFSGPDYLLLRAPFARAVAKRHERTKLRRLFICFGGADINNLTHRTLEAALAAGTFEQICIVTGGAYLYGEALHTFAAGHPEKVILHSDLSAEEMVTLMGSCDVAVCPCSGILFELCSVGIGLVSGYFVDNQQHIYQYLAEKGIFTPAADFNAISLAALTVLFQQIELKGINDQIKAQQKLVDGHSSQRLKKVFKKLVNETRLIAARVTMEDALTLFDWANDPITRANAINKDAIVWENHVRWLSKKLSDPESYLFIFTELATGKKIGLVRFDKEEDHLLISYLVDSTERGNGWGEVIMKLGMKQLWALGVKKSYRALVKEENVASSQVFINLAFRTQQSVLIENSKYFVYEK